jgi:hypothetical protein
VKDEFSIHVLKDVAISSALFRFAPNDKPCCAGLCRAAIGHGGAVSLQHCCFGRVRVVLNLHLRPWGVVDHSTTPTRATTKKPVPAESVAVCWGKLQSKGLGFGASCKQTLGFRHSSRTETYGMWGGD